MFRWQDTKTVSRLSRTLRAHLEGRGASREGISQGREVGVYILRPPAGSRISTRPLLHTPPTPRRASEKKKTREGCTMGPKMITHTFLLFGKISQLHRTSVTQGVLAAGIFCVIGRVHKVLYVSAPIAHFNCLGIDFPITRTFVTQKKCFRIICVIISGLIVIVHC